MTIKPAYVRMAWQVAAGRGIKFPSPDWDDFVAKFLNEIKLKDSNEPDIHNE